MSSALLVVRLPRSVTAEEMKVFHKYAKELRLKNFGVSDYFGEVGDQNGKLTGEIEFYIQVPLADQEAA